jgi:hypothetical protein
VTNGNPQKNPLFYPNNMDRKLGPSEGFHLKFRPTTTSKLGWRNWWSKHKNKNQVKQNENFKGISTYNFLDGLENVKNPYL